MSLMNNLTRARQAIDHVRWVCRYGASNKAEDKARTSKNLKTGEDVGELPARELGFAFTVRSLTEHLHAMGRDMYWKFEEQNEPSKGAGLTWQQRIPINAAAARTYRVGNCEEQASVAFEFLDNLGTRPLDLMTVGDHAFVVIGRTGDAGRFSSWGTVAIVCDPWANHDPNPMRMDDHWQAYPYHPATWASRMYQLRNEGRVAFDALVPQVGYGVT
jgi:hypothetical protein